MDKEWLLYRLDEILKDLNRLDCEAMDTALLPWGYEPVKWWEREEGQPPLNLASEYERRERMAHGPWVDPAV